jgi:hypothetical protein
MSVYCYLFLLLLACGGGGGGGNVGEDGNDNGNNPPTNVELECEVEDYPCSFAEVPIEILERSDALVAEVLAMFANGDSNDDIKTWLEGQADMAEVQADELAIRFRLDGGRGTWVLRKEAFATRSAADTPAAAHLPEHEPATVPRHIVGETFKKKKALVLSPYQWDMQDNADGAIVNAILSATRGYENGVTYHFNETKKEKKVNIESFKGWNGQQVVHVDSHGGSICDEGEPCRTVILAIAWEAMFDKPEGEIITPEEYAVIEEKGVVLVNAGERGSADLGLEADFFLWNYGGKENSAPLDNTMIFFNACETYGVRDTDLGDALRGNTSVFLGWDKPVLISAAETTSEALYRDLSERGYTIGTAYTNLGDLKYDANGAVLNVSERRAGGDLRIRDIVYLLNPASGEVLTPSDEVAIIGALNDDEPDSVPYLVQVDGIKKENASDAILHVSVDMIEADPQPILNGDVNDKDQWLLDGVVELPYDLDQETEVTFMAWVELPSGGESDHETTATLTGVEEPIMGRVWEMEVTTETGYGSVTNSKKTATLTLEFAEGQVPSEPHPKYFVTGGTVTYEAHSDMDHVGCFRTAPEVSFDLTEELIPDATSDKYWYAKLEFDTTVSPVEYWGSLFTWGPDLVAQQACPDGNYTTNYGPTSTWMSLNKDDHYTVTNSKLISGSRSMGSPMFHNQKWTIKRIK